MAGPNPVTVNVGADTSQLKAGLNAAGTELSKMKEGMGKARETAMFFTQALGEFGPQGRTAQIALSGIAGAIMGGGGVLLALSLAQTAVRLLTDAWREEKEAAEKAAKAEAEAAEERRRAATGQVRDATASITELRLANERLRFEVAGLTKEEIQERETLAKLKAERIGLTGAQLATVNLRIQEYERLIALNRELKTELELRKSLEELGGFDKGPGAAALPEVGPQALSTEAMEAYAGALRGLQEQLAGLARELNTTIGGLVPVATGSQNQAGTWAEAWVGASQTVAGAMEGMASSFLSSFTPMLTQSAAFVDAMEAAGGAAEGTADRSSAAYLAMAQNAMAALATEAAIKAIFQTAEGIAALWTPGGQAKAAGHFKSAALYAAVAGTAGAAAYAIGQNRGMTAAEKQQVEAQRERNAGTGAGSFTGSGSGGEIVKRETVYVIGNPLMSDAENARIAARTIETAQRLGLLRGAEVG